MKKILMVLVLVLITANAFALDLNYTLTTEFADRTVLMLKNFENAIWFDVAANPAWTDYQIAKEAIKKIIVRNVRRYEAHEAGQAAAQAVQEDTGGIE